MSSRSARIRSLNSKKIARIFTAIGLLLVWCLIGTPTAILFENVPLGPNGTYICSSKSTAFLLFAAFVYYPILEGVLPILLAIYFWWLTRNHVYSLNNQNFIRRFDKQITRMYLFQILANAIASFPFAVLNLYRSLTFQVVRSTSDEDIVQFVRLMAIWIFYVQYCTDFYIYIVISTEIRSEAAKILCFWRRRWTNRATAIQIHTATVLKTNNDITTNSFTEKNINS